LRQNVEDDAGLVDGAPQPVIYTGDLQRHLIEMPFVANLRQATTDLVGEWLAEFAYPLPHRSWLTMAASNSSTMREAEI
jgi:hypothetical protein